MDERAELQSQWNLLSADQRWDLFRSWVLSATAEFMAPDLVRFHWTGGSLVSIAIASDLESWHVAVADSIFDSASPDQALGIGDGIIESSHLLEEQTEEEEEEREEEMEDESAEGQEAADEARQEWEAEMAEALEQLMEELTQQLQSAFGALAESLQNAIDELQVLIDYFRDKLGVLDNASD